MSGGINMHFLDTHIANAYNNLTNIVLYLTPHETRAEKAVLVSAHYDSLIGTVGTCPARCAVSSQPHHGSRPRECTAMSLMTLLLLVCRGFRLRIAGRGHAGGGKGTAQQP